MTVELGSTPKTLIGVKECATALSLSIPEVRRRIKLGDIPHVRWGRRVLIPWREVEFIIEQMVVGSRSKTAPEGPR